ncbi:MAG: NAD-dependent epimerase/dehydratase family protein [Pseudomonadales bacterium]|nr:NAD-dependent epimerase/dehydratase family protein [Pseudomonadales bacterium]
MKVFVTGATGLVGAHSVLALLGMGHQVRLLVRNRDKARNYFHQQNVVVDDIVVGDMRDEPLVREAMSGCDAVLHSAALVGIERKRADEIFNGNLAGCKAVVGSAVEHGIKQILYVSSVGALFNPGLEEINENTPLGSAAEAYGKSKLACEIFVRALQEKGAPVKVTYPAGVIGPADPGLSESNHALKTFIETIVPITGSGGFQFVDARDVGLTHAMLLEKGCERDPREERYMLGGHYHTWSAFADRLDKLREKKVRRIALPVSVWHGMGTICDAIKYIVPFDFPMTRESMAMVTGWVPVNSSRVLKKTGLVFTAPDRTLTDTLHWLLEAGHLSQKMLGNLNE